MINSLSHHGRSIIKTAKWWGFDLKEICHGSLFTVRCVRLMGPYSQTDVPRMWSCWGHQKTVSFSRLKWMEIRWELMTSEEELIHGKLTCNLEETERIFTQCTNKSVSTSQQVFLLMALRNIVFSHVVLLCSVTLFCIKFEQCFWQFLHNTIDYRSCVCCHIYKQGCSQ